jgi:hypothetical protein
LAALVGTWKGVKGVDLAPEPGGDGMRYRETALLHIYDKSPHAHTDVDTLRRAG